MMFSTTRCTPSKAAKSRAKKAVDAATSSASAGEDKAKTCIRDNPANVAAAALGGIWVPAGMPSSQNNS